MEYNHAQNRYLALNGSESFTPEYTLFNLGLNAEVKYNNSKAIQIILQLNNMLDKAYRSHLNRLKYFEYYSSSPNGHDGIYDMGRNLSLKIIVFYKRNSLKIHQIRETFSLQRTQPTILCLNHFAVRRQMDPFWWLVWSSVHRQPDC